MRILYAGDDHGGVRVAREESAPEQAGLNAFFQRCHPAPLETCGCVADYNPATSKLTVWETSQAPHAHRTLFALVAGLPEHNIRIVAPDIGGGFGNKVPIYPGYVCAVVASIQLGRPVKWIETRSENLQSNGFARDYHMTAEIAAERDGTVKALRVKTLADHGAFNAAAQPSKFPAGLFSICTGSYDFSEAFCEVDGVYTNKAPGGIAYRCSFRVTEAAYLIERAMDVLAQELKMDPAELRLKNFIPADNFPYQSPLGWSYDSGDYKAAMNLALEKVGYQELRKEQEQKRREGKLMGIGISSFTEIVGAGPAHTSISATSRCSTVVRSGFIQPAKPSHGWGRRRKGKAMKQHLLKLLRKSSVFRSRTSRSRRATPTPLRTAWGHTRAGARRQPAPLRQSPPGKSARKPERLRRICLKRVKKTWNGNRENFSSKGLRARPRRFRGKRQHT